MVVVRRRGVGGCGDVGGDVDGGSKEGAVAAVGSGCSVQSVGPRCPTVFFIPLKKFFVESGTVLMEHICQESAAALGKHPIYRENLCRELLLANSLLRVNRSFPSVWGTR